jgi:beta-glucosidase
MVENKTINIEELLNKMTLKEKIGQLLQLAPTFLNPNKHGEITGPMSEMGISKDDINNTGSVLGISGAFEMKEIQKEYLKNSAHKIPLVFMADIIHGYRTIFPVPLAIGCSWDMDVAHKVARISAKEATAAGIHVTFSPMVDLVRDPRWGRVMESTGEDPYLNSLYARAFVKGYQGDDISKDENMAACVKHFAAYGVPEGGRDYNTVDISERMLREYYLPTYKAAIDEGCKMLMTAFNTVDSVPPSGNEWLMRDLLREEWKFDGVVISDWGAVKELIPHGVAEDECEAAKKAIKAGVDIEMMTSCYTKHLEELVENGQVDEKLIDEGVLRILKLKEELGLFKNPYKGADEEKEKRLIVCEEHRKEARDVATKSMVLLKNQDILPFSKDIEKIAIIGPFADNNLINGPWSWQGKPEENITLKQGIINKIGEEKVVVSLGCGIEDGSDEDIKNAIEIAKGADVVLLALGEHQDMSGEGGSRAFITLPGRQQELVEAIIKLNKKTAVVLFNGRPLEIKPVADKVPAILEAWFPGTEGGNAIADIIFGDKNPSGRLTMSFPYTVGQIPVYYNCFNTGRPSGTDRYWSHYQDIPNAPLYPFGYGLGYTKFEYTNFELSSDTLDNKNTITAKVKVKNIGNLQGEEVVQLYIRDVSGSVVRPIKELKGFEKISLISGEEKEVIFDIKEEMLRYYTLDLEFKSEPGKFIAMIGSNSNDVFAQEFKLV